MQLAFLTLINKKLQKPKDVRDSLTCTIESWLTIKIHPELIKTNPNDRNNICNHNLDSGN